MPQSFWKLATLQSPSPEQKQVTACSILGQVSILCFNEISILTTAAGQFKFSQSDLKWVPHESIACDWHISESTMAEIWSKISYRVAFLFSNSNDTLVLNWTIYFLDFLYPFDSSVLWQILMEIWLFFGNKFSYLQQWYLQILLLRWLKVQIFLIVDPPSTKNWSLADSENLWPIPLTSSEFRGISQRIMRYRPDWNPCF